MKFEDNIKILQIMRINLNSFPEVGTERKKVALDAAMETMYKYQQLLTDYEAKLKADMVAMLEELQLEIENTVKEEKSIDKKWANGLHYSEKIIQQKINELKENEDGSNNN